MMRTSRCPDCRADTEPGDRFCQECGVRLPSGDQGQSKRVFSLNEVRAEAILLAAAIVYAASVLCWFDRRQIDTGIRSLSAAIKTVPALLAAKTARPSRADKAPVKSEVDELFASAKQSLSNDAHAHSAAAKMAVVSQAVQRAARAQDAASAAPAEAPHKLAASKYREPAAASAAPSPHVVATAVVPPEQATAASPMVAARESLPPVQSAARTHAQKGLIAAKPTVKPDARDLAEYNRLLADYFTRQATVADADNKTPAPAEPPSYDEWLAGNRQPF